MVKSEMTQIQRLDYLLEQFKIDSGRYRNLKVPDDPGEKRSLLRSLMNVRMPKDMPREVIEVQDAYLSERAEEKGIVRLSDIPVAKGSLSIWQGDITRLAVDAIVNAANPQMLGCFVPMHNCIDNCIHTFAGVQLRAECGRIMDELRKSHGMDYERPVAEPLLTGAYNLPARMVLHVVGPVVDGRLTPENESDLALCYERCLDMCLENGIRSVAFCCISTGVFGFPNRRASEIAVETVSSWLSGRGDVVERVVFNVFKDEDRMLYEALLI